MLKRCLILVSLLTMAACDAPPVLIGSDLAYQRSVPPDQRQACASLTDEQAVVRAREWFMAKSEARRRGPAWEGRDPTKLEVLSVERTNVAVVKFGTNGETRVTAFIYEDCMVGWG